MLNFFKIQIKLFPLLIKINMPPLSLLHVAEGSFSDDGFWYLVPNRNDKTRRSWFCHWRPEWRRGEGWLLEDGDAQHRPPTKREASLSNGRGVRSHARCLNLNHKMDVIFFFNCLSPALIPPHRLQVCCRSCGVRCLGMWYVWLCFPHTHCSKLPLPPTRTPMHPF